MRSSFHALVRMSLVFALVLPVTSGCSKQVLAPANSRPLPAGEQSGDLLMLGWHEQASLSYTVADPGTPQTNLDDALFSTTRDFWATPNGIRTATFDVTNANQLQAFRIGTDGNANPLFDFQLQPSLRFVGQDLDLYEFEDISPGVAPLYVGRGTLDGDASTQSPVSNLAAAATTIDETLDFLLPAKLAAGDSVLKVQFAEDPRAAFYIVELTASAGGVLGTGSSFSTERRLRGIPSPLLPGRRSLTSAAIITMPAGSGPTGFSARLTSRTWPLFFYVRVSAFDSEYRMVNRLNDYLRTPGRDGPLLLTTHEPLGGAIEVLDPYPDPVAPLPVPEVETRDVAMALFQRLGGSLSGPGTILSATAAPSASEASSPAAVSAMQQLAAHPRFSAQALRQGIAAVRARLDRRAAGSPALGATRNPGTQVAPSGH